MKRHLVLVFILLTIVLLVVLNSCDDKETAPIPAIESFSPASGAIGTLVTINGTNFSTTASENIVKFGTIDAIVSSATEGQLQVTVPVNAVTAVISVTVGDRTATSSGQFVVTPPPAITSFTPKQGPGGTLVTITGSNFSTIVTDNAVKFGTVNALINSASATELKVTVPENAVTGLLSVKVGSQEITSVETFTVIPTPVITSISPIKGFPGDRITITGSYFSAIADNNIVKFGTVPIHVESASTTQLIINVPDELDNTLTVTVSEVVSAPSQKFDVLNRINVTTLAGGSSANYGYVEGTGSAARFTLPGSMVMDPEGNLLVCDNAVIRKVTTGGVATTFAGSATTGTNDGTGSAAQFLRTNAITKDPSGNYYIADYFRIRKVTPNAVVSAFVGSGNSGYTNGTGATAEFLSIDEMASDSHGNLFVSETSGYRIRKVTPSGEVTTFAGKGSYDTNDGQGAAAGFAGLGGIMIDASDNLYVIDNPRIRKITPDGTVTTFAGGASSGNTDGSLSEARFYNMTTLVMGPRGDIYVVDSGNSRIRRITPQGIVSTFLGNQPGFAEGGQSEARFYLPYAIAFDKNDNLYLSDKYNNIIRKITIE